MPATIQETNFQLPGQIGDVYHGKVRDVYTVQHEAGDLLVAVCTDKISAYDVVLPALIPHKGQVLNQMSATLLQATANVAPNWLLDAPDPNVSIGLRAEPLKIEMIVRGFLLGNAWRAYQRGERNLCGNPLPSGMEEFQSFQHPLLTPTTKANQGHDENITPHEIITSGLATAQEFDAMAEFALTMFDVGRAMAHDRGLVLADTKYEFGRLATGEIIVIDEIHTPDSSRYFPASEFGAYVRRDTKVRPVQLSDEFVREWLAARGFTGQPGEVLPPIDSQFPGEVSAQYFDLYERMLGRPLVVPERADEPLARIEENIHGSLAELWLR